MCVRLVAALCGVGVLAGCGTWTIRVEQVPPPDVTRWQEDITAATNAHTHRLDALEARCPTPLSIGGP